MRSMHFAAFAAGGFENTLLSFVPHPPAAMYAPSGENAAAYSSSGRSAPSPPGPAANGIVSSSFPVARSHRCSVSFGRHDPVRMV